MTDALGNTVVINGIYGYSKRANGSVSVIIGKLIKIGEKNVSLEVLKSGSSIYAEPIQDNVDLPSRPSIVTANSIFPLPNSNTDW